MLLVCMFGCGATAPAGGWACCAAGAMGAGLAPPGIGIGLTLSVLNASIQGLSFCSTGAMTPLRMLPNAMAASLEDAISVRAPALDLVRADTPLPSAEGVNDTVLERPPTKKADEPTPELESFILSERANSESVCEA